MTPAETAHQSGFSAGVTHGNFVIAYGEYDGEPLSIPDRYEHEAPHYEEGWYEGIDLAIGRGGTSIGSTDGEHYDQCEHWTRPAGFVSKWPDEEEES
jgi:hypothetical protein